ncbi:hypothetical protein BT69DRAFT_1315589, partial [Atractiella rhizophila]
MGEISKSTKGLKFMQRAAAKAAQAQTSASVQASASPTTIPSTSTAPQPLRKSAGELPKKLKGESGLVDAASSKLDFEPSAFAENAQKETRRPQRMFINESSSLLFPSISSISTGASIDVVGRQKFGASMTPAEETSTSATNKQTDPSSSSFYLRSAANSKIPVQVLARGADIPKKKRKKNSGAGSKI